MKESDVKISCPYKISATTSHQGAVESYNNLRDLKVGFKSLAFRSMFGFRKILTEELEPTVSF